MNTLKYFRLLFLPLLLALSNNLSAQTNNTDTPANRVNTVGQSTDTIAKIKPVPFLRLGIDISALARQIAESEVQQFEFSLDSEIKYNWFAILEGGFMKVNADRPDFNYQANGYFARFGADYNLLSRPHQKQNDLVVLGVRYAYSLISHEASDFLISNPYWGSSIGMVDRSNFHVHWIEFSGGVKTEVFRNIFLGWSLKTRVRLYETKDPDLNPYFIGGYGHGKRRAPVMVHFSVMYRLGF